MKRNFIKAIASMLVLSILIGLPAFGNSIKVEAAESKKVILEKVGTNEEYDNFAYYADGTLLAYKGEEDSNKKEIYSYNYDKGKFEHVSTQYFDSWDLHYSSIALYYGDIRIKKGDYYGILNRSGEVDINPQYSELYVYHTAKDNEYSYYTVKDNGTTKIVDNLNNDIFSSITGSFEADFLNDKLVLTKNTNGKLELINLANKESLELDYTDYRLPYSRYNLIGVKGSNDLWGLIDFEGNIVRECQYEYIYLNYNEIEIEKDGITGKITLDGNEVLYEDYYISNILPNGYSIVLAKDQHLYGIVNANGDIIVDFQYTRITNMNNKGLVCALKETDAGKEAFLIDVVNNKIIKSFEIEYDWIHGISDELIWVVNYDDTGSKYGAVNFDNELVVALEIDYIDIFYSEKDVYLINIEKDGKYGLVNGKGELIIPIEYDHINTIYSEVIYAYKDNKVTLFDDNGNVVIPPKYSSIDVLDNGYARVSYNDKFGVIDKSGKEVIEFGDYYIFNSENLFYKISKDSDFNDYFNEKAIIEAYLLREVDANYEDKKPEEPVKEDKKEEKVQQVQTKKVNNIEVSLEAELKEGVKLDVTPIESSDRETTEKIEKALSKFTVTNKEVNSKNIKYDKFVAFDINLLDEDLETKVQPDGKVTVTFTIPEGFNKENLSVFRVEDDGTATKMEGKVVGDKYEFYTDHFSIYVLASGTVEEETETTPVETDGSDTNDKKVEETSSKKDIKAPKTGDESPVVFLALALVAGLGLFIIGLSNKDKRRTK